MIRLTCEKSIIVALVSFIGATDDPARTREGEFHRMREFILTCIEKFRNFLSARTSASSARRRIRRDEVMQVVGLEVVALRSACLVSFVT